MKVYVLTAQYSDGSGFYVKRAFASKARAREDFELAKGDSLLQWELHELEVTGPTYDYEPDTAASVLELVPPSAPPVDEDIPL